MCGIVGILNLKPGAPPTENYLRQMLAMIRHRGPDEFGIYLDAHVGLGNARLSIIDLTGGQQPISNEDGTLWIVFNGEIFNYVELRPDLEARGHRFSTQSDTEVLLHLYEEYGPRCLERLNGQFAFAIWNTRDQSLFLARDRLGVRPLFYTFSAGSLIFGSEIKAIFADRRVRAELDPVALDQIFTFWCTLSPRTVFKDIVDVPPGHYLLVKEGVVSLQQYWQIDFRHDGEYLQPRPLDDYLDEFESLLVDAVAIRLRADVSVGAYLSGGLDSAVIASLIRNSTKNRLATFSIAFDDDQFDESPHQHRMARFLGTAHQVVQAKYSDIGEAFPDVIWHTETPIMRTAPAPMYLLSQLARNSGYKVVLTGEGADEFLGGYDIFKEDKVRRFWARQPDSTWRPLLFKRLYPDIAGLGKINPAFLAAFFRGALTEVDVPGYSHDVRWRNNRRTRRFLAEDLRIEIAKASGEAIDHVAYPPRFSRWGPLERAQFLEQSIFMSQYLLSSQGDRVALAHSIETRHPFLDCRVIEFCNRLPSNLKLRALTEKYLLKKLSRKWVPLDISQRSKRPYRAPIRTSFFHGSRLNYVCELLSAAGLTKSGLFCVAAVRELVTKVERGAQVGEIGEMALVGVLSTQLVHHYFIDRFKKAPQLSGNVTVKIGVTNE